jgi:hypothetical protein
VMFKELLNAHGQSGNRVAEATPQFLHEAAR